MDKRLVAGIILALVGVVLALDLVTGRVGIFDSPPVVAFFAWLRSW